MDINIYGLIDPRTNKIRYIGYTKHTPEERLQVHIKNMHKDKNRHKVNWLNKLINAGLIPTCITLDTVSNEYRDIAEKIWIRYAKSQEWPLVNVAEGGNGGPLFAGHNHKPESKKKISRSGSSHPMYGKHPTEESIQKNKESNTGKRRSEEFCKRCSISHTGLKASEETKKKLSMINSGSNNPMYGKLHTAKHNKNISDSLSGENNPMYGKLGENNPNFGRKNSEETISKMRKSALIRWARERQGK